MQSYRHPAPMHLPNPNQAQQSGGQQQQTGNYANPSPHVPRPARSQQPRQYVAHNVGYPTTVPVYFTHNPQVPLSAYSYQTGAVSAQHSIPVQPAQNILSQQYIQYQYPGYGISPIRSQQPAAYGGGYHDNRQQPQPGTVPQYPRVPIQYPVHAHQQHGHATMTSSQQQPPQPQTPQQQQQQQQQQIPIHQPANQSQIQSQNQHVPQSNMSMYSREGQGGGAHRGMGGGDQSQGQISSSMIGSSSGSGAKETGTMRKRKILQIIDPTTGKNVIAKTDEAESTPDAGKTDEKKTSGAETPEVSAAGLGNSTTSTVTSTGNGPVPPSTSSDGGAATGGGPREATPAPPADDPSSKAKLEFYKKISEAVDPESPKPKTEEGATTNTAAVVNKSTDEETTGSPTTPAGEPTPPAVTPSSATSSSTTAITTAPNTPTVSAASNNNSPTGTTVTSAGTTAATTPDPTPTTSTPRSSPTVEAEEKGTEETLSGKVAGEALPSEAKTVATVTTTTTTERVVEEPSPTATTSTAEVEEEEEVVTLLPVAAHADDKNDDEEIVSLSRKVDEPVLTNGVEKSEEEERDNVPSDAHDLSTTSISPTPLDDYCDNSGRSLEGSAVGDLTSSLNEEDKNTDDQNVESAAGVAHEDDEDLEDGEIEENGPDEEDDKPGEENETKSIRQYDRDLLLRIRESTASKTKIDIAVPEVVKDGKGGNVDKSPYGRPPMNHTPGSHYGSNRGRGPKEMRMPPPMMHPNMGRMGGWAMGGIGGPLAIPPTPPRAPRVLEITTKVELSKAENAWKPTRAQARSGSGQSGEAEMNEDEKKKDEIVKATRGILNKLTPENHSKLLERFLKLELNDREDRISAVIKVVFEKAVDEPNFSAAYARMVHEVCSKSPETSKKFRKQILDQCQQEFQKSNKDEDEITKAEAAYEQAAEDKKAELKAELEEKKFQMRRRSLGNVRFIGELFKLQMLTPKIMVDCVQMLLGNQDEENLECLCKLLSTVGQRLDMQLKDIETRIKELTRKGQPLPKFIPEENYMDKTFKKLKQLSNDTSKLSSRIRFALLDVVELREMDWKPRRDANAPKTIEEVRRDAARQEQEEKQKINALPEERGSRRPSPMNAPSSGPPKKGSDWNTVQPSNKSSRFQVKQRTDSSNSPVLAPHASLGWQQQQQSPMGRSVQPNARLPPRFQQNQQQQQQNQGMSSRFNQPPSANNRFNHFISLNDPSPSSGGSGSTGGPPQLMPTHRQRSPPPAAVEPPPKQPEADNFDLNETVKNIFEEFLSVQKFEDTLDWIKNRFKGDKVLVFVDCLARKVAEMSKENQQCGAGKLIKMLIKNRAVQRDQVVKTIKEGVIPDVPDIEVDTPKVTSYLAMFVLELFGDEQNLNWLVELVEPLVEDFGETREALIKDTLNLFKMKRNEQFVKSLWSQTSRKDSLIIESLPWLNDESRNSLVDKMIPVLTKENEPNEIVNIFKENSWDLRESDISSALIVAICEVCYQNGTWDKAKLGKLVPLLNKPSGSQASHLWKAAKEYLNSKKVGKEDEECLWKQLLDSGVITNRESS